MIALLDGHEVHAPAPGWFRRLVEHDHLVAPGDVIGELDVLGRVTRLIAPRIRGIVKLQNTAVRRPVVYGELLFQVSTEALISGAGDADAPAQQSAAGLVFRAPTSGRFYGRPTPDKPPFLEAGAEVATGATVCLLEVMKTFHRVTYGGPDMPSRARVRAVLVTDGADVNAGDPLLSLDAG